MLIKEADFHLAAKLRKLHILQSSAIGQISSEHPVPGSDDTVANGRSQEPLKPASGFVRTIRPSHGH